MMDGLRNKLMDKLYNKNTKKVIFVGVYAGIGVVFASIFTFAQMVGSLPPSLATPDSVNLGMSTSNTQVTGTTAATITPQAVDPYEANFTAIKSYGAVNGSIDVQGLGSYDIITKSPNAPTKSAVSKGSTTDGSGVSTDMSSTAPPVADGVIVPPVVAGTNAEETTPIGPPPVAPPPVAPTTGSMTTGGTTTGGQTNSVTPLVGPAVSTPDTGISPKSNISTTVSVNGVRYAVISPSLLTNPITKEQVKLSLLSSDNTDSSIKIQLDLPVAGVIYTIKDKYLDTFTDAAGNTMANQGLNLEVYQDSYPVYSMQTGTVTSVTKTASGTRVSIVNSSLGLGTVYDGLSNVTVSKGDTVKSGMSIGNCDNKLKPEISPILHIEVYGISNGSQIAYDPEELNYIGA